MNTTWSVRIERLRAQLRVGVSADELAPQPVWVTVRLRGVSAACPTALSECIDYAPLCRWITEEWPRTPHVPLLETRVNELVAFAFNLDRRVQEVHVGLAKERMSATSRPLRRWRSVPLGGTSRQRESAPVSGSAASVGIERCVSRPEFEAQRRHLEVTAASPVPSERTCDDRLPA